MMKMFPFPTAWQRPPGPERVLFRRANTRLTFSVQGFISVIKIYLFRLVESDCLNVETIPDMTALQPVHTASVLWLS
jgi:hypothetical protein